VDHQKFCDREAEFIYVPKEKVFDQAKELEAIPYDIPGAEYSHYGNECTFDFIIKKHNITDRYSLQLAEIVRAADTASFDLAPQAQDCAISAGFLTTIKMISRCLPSG
jgi:hypothetical protein